MKKILVLIAVTLIVSCSSNGIDCCTNIDTGVYIQYLNEEGTNLLEMDGGLTVADISIYHKLNNGWIKYYDGNMDSPKGIEIVEQEEGTYLLIFPSTTIVENNYSETKIGFSESDFDILKTEIDKRNSDVIVTKVWYNDVLMWERNQTNRLFKIVR